jgi:hypothetical protein
VEQNTNLVDQLNISNAPTSPWPLAKAVPPASQLHLFAGALAQTNGKIRRCRGACISILPALMAIDLLFVCVYQYVILRHQIEEAYGATKIAPPELDPRKLRGSPPCTFNRCRVDENSPVPKNREPFARTNFGRSIPGWTNFVSLFDRAGRCSYAASPDACVFPSSKNVEQSLVHRLLICTNSPEYFGQF